jgi:hypothetical protein
MAHVLVTVNHNDDELVLTVDDKPVATVSIAGTSTMAVQDFLETLLESIDDARTVSPEMFLTIEKIDEDRRKTVNEW